MDFISELKWRGLIKDMIPRTDELLKSKPVTGYIGFDPTATSLHVGSLAQVMLLRLFQKCGHKPIVVLGGATGMIGDPSGKSEERNLLSEDEVRHNGECLRRQLTRFLDFGSGPNAAELLNNYEWYRSMNLLHFLRDVGKHLTINYMVAKDSVKSRMDTGISYTEFTYQLLQAYDFLWLLGHKNCRLQMGGSDQWGNITAGTELCRRIAGQDVFGLTIPLITKADGGKFGKTETGNVWLDPKMTSPYKFYQFWINTPDHDAPHYLHVFTQLSKSDVSELEREHAKAPQQRLIQKRLAEELTVLVHSRQDLEAAARASEILFGKAAKDELAALDEQTFLDVFEGVPQFSIARADLNGGCNIVELLSTRTQVFASKSEVRRTLKEGGLSVNKERVGSDDRAIVTEDLLNQRYLLVQKGKKNYFIIKVH
jgi:tyrosyl-tRNA synthetase